MATRTHRFRIQAPSSEYMTRECGGVITRVAISHQMTADFSIPDELLDSAVGTLSYPNNWEYVEADPPASSGKTINQTIPSSLAADASSIPVASGWVDVISATFQTKGGTIVGVQFSGVGTPSIGEGQLRILINGGSFSDVVLGASFYSIPILQSGCASGNVPKIIPATENYTSYTIKMQMQATGVLGSVIPKAGTQLTIVEYY